jgi:hypothetical protein
MACSLQTHTHKHACVQIYIHTYTCIQAYIHTRAHNMLVKQAQPCLNHSRTDRQTDRQTNRQTDKQTNRQTESSLTCTLTKTGVAYRSWSFEVSSAISFAPWADAWSSCALGVDEGGAESLTSPDSSAAVVWTPTWPGKGALALVERNLAESTAFFTPRNTRPTLRRLSTF